MKERLKKILPKKIYSLVRELYRYLRLMKSFRYDLNHYFRYSMSSNKNIIEKKIISKIILDTHVIEKGLTMPKTKFGFGYLRLEVLMNNLIDYILRYGKDDPQVLHGISVVNEYFDFHEKVKFKIEKRLLELYEKLLIIIEDRNVVYESRSQIEINKESYFQHVEDSFVKFSSSRSSIRNFSSEKIDEEVINKALNLCLNTPSACNRQSVRLHKYNDYNQIQNILRIQGGNRGFGHLTSCLIIVTYDSSFYFEESERNTGYVDGGMYCMNLLYSLHAHKIGACILNTSHNPHKDMEIRKYTNLPESESFVAMVACGIPPSNFKIAKSFRYPLNYILTRYS